MTAYPKHYLTDVPQELRLKVLDFCIHRQWHDALDLLHQNGFTQYEWYELVWFHDHAPTNLEPRSADGPSALELPLRAGDLSLLGSNERNSPEAKVRSGPNERARASHWAPGEVSAHVLPPSAGPGDPGTLTTPTETLTVGRNSVEPNLNSIAVKVPKPRSKSPAYRKTSKPTLTPCWHAVAHTPRIGSAPTSRRIQKVIRRFQKVYRSRWKVIVGDSNQTPVLHWELELGISLVFGDW